MCLALRIYLLFTLYFAIPSYAQFSYNWEINSEAVGLSRLYAPYYVAVNAEDETYVIEDDHILKLAPDGSFLLRFGTHGLDDGQFNVPSGIAVGSNGNVYVADLYNHRVQKFDSNGSFISEFGSFGHDDGQLDTPYKVAVDNDSNVYVICRNGVIQKFTSSGGFILKFGSLGKEEGQLDGPSSIAIDNNGDLYIVDTNNDRVQKFTSNGNFILEFGILGSEKGQFDHPIGIAIDDKGSILVSDAANHRIQKFTPNGTFISAFGTYGSDEGQFYFPRHIAIGKSGDLYVADQRNNRIQKFDSNSEFVWQVGAGTRDSEFRSPGGITIDSKGNIYVADRYNHRIQKFASDGSFLLKFGSCGTDTGQFDVPAKVFADLDDNIYVSDIYNRRVQKFTSSGKFLSQFKIQGNYEGQFMKPGAIDKDAAGNIYITESGYERIYTFTPDGRFISKFGSSGPNDNQLRDPSDIIVDADNSLYVADYQNERVKKFTSDGRFLLAIGSRYLGETGYIKNPISITFGTDGNLYIADETWNRIQKFAPNGKFLKEIYLYGSSGEQHIDPTSIRIDKLGNLYMSDGRFNMVQKYTPNFKFLADSISSYPEEVISISIRATNFTEIISAQATLEWNSEIAELISAEAVSIADTRFNTSFADRGKMSFSWYERSNAAGLSLPDSAILFNLRFRLVGKPGKQTAISFTSSLTPLEVTRKDEVSVDVGLQPGVLHIQSLKSICGNIFTEANQPVKGAKAILEGYTFISDSTDMHGKFEISDVHPYQPSTVTASKEYDDNYANGLTSLDLAIIQRHILETKMLSSPYKLIAADVDLSESITTADIIDLQDVVLGNTDCLAKNKHWTFIPESFVFTDPTHPYPYDTALVYDTMPSRTGHNFIGIKLGDVNDTWDPARGRRQQKQIKFFVEQHQTLTEGTITVPVKVADFKDVSSFQFTLEWNKDVLIFESAQGKELPEIVFGEKYTENGQLTVLWYDLQGSSISLSDEQVAFTITFKTKGRIGDQSAVSLSSARTPLLAYDATNTEMDTEAIPGVVEIVQVLGLSESLKPTSYKLYQNEPNPFTNSVKLKFALPHKSLVVLRVMNATGQALYEVENTFEQGIHIILWDGKSSQGMTLHSGVYFVQFVADSFHETIKVIKR